jgi:hypothetical protein
MNQWLESYPYTDKEIIKNLTTMSSIHGDELICYPLISTEYDPYSKLGPFIESLNPESFGEYKREEKTADGSRYRRIYEHATVTYSKIPTLNRIDLEFLRLPIEIVYHNDTKHGILPIRIFWSSEPLPADETLSEREEVFNLSDQDFAPQYMVTPLPLETANSISLTAHVVRPHQRISQEYWVSEGYPPPEIVSTDISVWQIDILTPEP